MKAREKILSSSAEQTRLLAKQIASTLKPGSVLALFGDLGCGKTTFVQGLTSLDDVFSPTFSYLHIYPTQPTLYHFDLYRLHSADDFTALGFHEYFRAGGICCIEWSERIPSLLPPETIRIYFEHGGGDLRKIEIER